MNRGGFFGRIAQSLAIPAAVVVGRALPAATPMATGVSRLDPDIFVTAEYGQNVAVLEGEPFNELQYAFEYPNGALSLLQTHDEAVINLMWPEASDSPIADGAMRLVRFLQGREIQSWSMESASRIVREDGRLDGLVR